MAYNFACQERYLLQPKKTVAITINPKKDTTTTYYLGEEELSNVDSAAHLGLTRTTSIRKNAEVNVDSNIGKARRAAYSLMGAGLHGQNGLDPATSLNMYKVYVLPVLTYGLEVVLPSTRLTEKLELFQKKMLKQILSLPNNAADPCIYILSGVLPVAAVIDLKTLSFFNSILNQEHTSLEKRLFLRQYAVKRWKSNSWSKQIQPILTRYDLGDVDTFIENPLSKVSWKRCVHKVIEAYWKRTVEERALLYPSLRFMNCTYQPGKLHPVLAVGCECARESTRIPTRIRLLTGTYILQTNRARYNQNPISPLCPLCGCHDETVQHFILDCATLEDAREPVLREIWAILEGSSAGHFIKSPDDLLRLIIDFTTVLPAYLCNDSCGEAIEFHARRLTYRLHTLRYKLSQSTNTV